MKEILFALDSIKFYEEQAFAIPIQQLDNTVFGRESGRFGDSDFNYLSYAVAMVRSFTYSKYDNVAFRDANVPFEYLILTRPDKNYVERLDFYRFGGGFALYNTTNVNNTIFTKSDVGNGLVTFTIRGFGNRL